MNDISMNSLRISLECPSPNNRLVVTATHHIAHSITSQITLLHHTLQITCLFYTVYHPSRQSWCLYGIQENNLVWWDM